MRKHAARELDASLLDRLVSLVGGKAGATAVFGAPFERDGITVIPVASSRFGFGGGGGRSPALDGRGEGSGGGGGAVSRPLGFIEIQRGRARFRRVTNPLTLSVALLVIATAVAILARAAGHLSNSRDLVGARRQDETPSQPGDTSNEAPSP